MGRNKSKAELETEIRFLRKSHWSTSITSVINSVFKYGSLAFIAWCARDMIFCLAGKTTLAVVDVDIFDINFVTELGLTKIAGTLVVFGATCWALLERKLRKKAIKRLHEHPKKLETIIDSKRSTSRLTIEGETRPEDK